MSNLLIVHLPKLCLRVYLLPSQRNWETCSQQPPMMPSIFLRTCYSSTQERDSPPSKPFSTLTWPSSTTLMKSQSALRRSSFQLTTTRSSQLESIEINSTRTSTRERRRWERRSWPSIRHTINRWAGPEVVAPHRPRVVTQDHPSNTLSSSNINSSSTNNNNSINNNSNTSNSRAQSITKAKTDE